MGPVSKLAVLLSCAVLAAASSYPDKTTCWAEDPSLGYIVKGNLTGRNMWWTAAPVRTDAYTVRTGDSCESDPTSYVPGQYMGIHVRTHKYKGQFRGILIYAVALATGQRVGDWVLPWPNSNMFWKPQGACQNKSLMHLNGAEKYYHHEFLWQPPAAGTGDVEFHVLIKRGQANLGEFFWPNLNGNLILKEGQATGGDRWVEGQQGQSCTDACTQAGSTCDANVHNGAWQTGALLQRDAHLTVKCNVPALESNLQVIYKDPSGWCYYPSQQAGAATTACSMPAPGNSTPICACGNAGLSKVVLAPRDTACLNSYVSMNSASRASSSLVSIALMLFTTFWFFQPRKTSSALFLALILGCAQCVQAHNWVIGVSRSFNQASTYKPCRPRVNDQPHWQINEGQLFNIEWATGHDWYFYFTIVNSKDLNLLEDINEDDLDKYIDGCPDSQDFMRGKQGLNQPGHTVDNWRKQHITGTTTSMTTELDYANQPIYTKNVSAGDPLYFVRPQLQYGIMGNEVRWIYTNPNTDSDRRCNYYNATYPFLIAVHRFVQVQTPMSRAGDRDIAQFTIDLSGHRTHGYGQGSYVVQYLWRGYFDCIDVDVFDAGTPVINIGGIPLDPNDPKWNKVDHCQFEEVQSVFGNCMEVVTDASSVLTQCANDRNGNCGGVNVVPLWLPGDVYPLFSNRVGIPWSFQSTMMNGGGCNYGQFATLGKNTLVGYGLLPRLPNNTHASYSVTDDPEDPLFYATCFILKPAFKFDLSVSTNPNASVVFVPPPWAYATRCVDCDVWQLAQDTDIIPRWTLPAERNCRNCEAQPPSPISSLALNIISRGQKCDGSWSGSTTWYFGAPNAQCAGVRCIKSLTLVGTGNTITPDQCIAKAKLDPECSEHVQHNSAQGSTCECWTKTNPTCCGTCKPVDYVFQNYRFNVYTTALQSGDATCTNGVKSADGANCCPKSCGAWCPSKPTFQVSFQPKTYLAPYGWAVDDGTKYAKKTNTYPQIYDTYGWNCDRSDVAEDRDAAASTAKNNNGTSYHATYVKLDNTATCTGTSTWNLLIGANGTSVDMEVHILYSRAFQQISGCTLNQSPNFDRRNLGQNDMSWVVRSVSVTGGTLSWSGSQNSGCGGIAALRIFPSTGLPAVDCQTLPGQCCPHFLDLASRPCSSHQPPCSM